MSRSSSAAVAFSEIRGEPSAPGPRGQRAPRCITPGYALLLMADIAGDASPSAAAGRARPALDPPAPHRPSSRGRTAASPLRTRRARTPGARSPRSGSCRSCPASLSTAAPRTAMHPRPQETRCHRRPAHPPAGEPPRHVPPDRRVIPGRGRDELLQPLMAGAQPRRHRLHRLALPIGQQPARIQLARRALVLAPKVTEHLRSKARQPRPDPRDLLRGHPGMTVQSSAQERETRRTDLTKSY